MKKIELKTARSKLLLLWSIFCLVIISLMITKSVGNMFGSKINEAWSWLLPTIIPTISLMVSIIFNFFKSSTNEKQEIPKNIFQIAWAFSFFYLLLVCVSVFDPFSPSLDSINFMKMSNFWLGPLQGINSLILCAFFIKSKCDART